MQDHALSSGVVRDRGQIDAYLLGALTRALSLVTAATHPTVLGIGINDPATFGAFPWKVPQGRFGRVPFPMAGSPTLSDGRFSHKDPM